VIFYNYVVAVHCHCHPHCCRPVFLLNLLSNALAPLHHPGIAEPKLLLRSICFVRASAAYLGCLLLASTAEAPSLGMTFPPSYLFEAKCPPNCRRLDGGNGSGRLLHNGSSPCANTLLNLDEFASEPYKEFEAAHCSVVGMDHLMEK
jgi:hypothetical protein